jgi:hypothetical protein
MVLPRKLAGRACLADECQQFGVSCGAFLHRRRIECEHLRLEWLRA